MQLTWGAAAGGPHGALHRSSSSPIIGTAAAATASPALGGGPEDSAAPGGSGALPLPGTVGDVALYQLQPSTSEGTPPPPPSSVARYPPPPHPAAAAAYWGSDLGRRQLEEELQAVLDVQLRLQQKQAVQQTVQQAVQHAVQQAGRGGAAARRPPSRAHVIPQLRLRLEHLAPLFDGSGASLLLEVVVADISGARAQGAAVLPGDPPHGEATATGGAFSRLGGRGALEAPLYVGDEAPLPPPPPLRPAHVVAEALRRYAAAAAAAAAQSFDITAARHM